MPSDKIIPFEDCQERLEAVRGSGQRIVHCHGAFDLLHPGHIRHLEEAKQHGDVLVVSLTSAPYVNKGPGRPVFSDDERAYQLAHLAVVDYVVAVPCAGAVEIIERVQPHVYCKGIEYASPANETDQRVEEDAAAVARFGGEIRFVGDALHSSSRLAAEHLGFLEPELRGFLDSMPEGTLDSLEDVLQRVAALRVLVVGEVIIDRYTYCYVQGLTTKARVLSVRPQREDDQLGGSLAVARQLASYGCATRLVALAGEEPWLDEDLRPLEDEPLQLDLLRDPDYATILKQRFCEQPGKRKEVIKHFAVTRMVDAPPPALRDALRGRIEELLPEVDLVVLCDYGHGMIDAELQALLEDHAPFLALNVQTNSANYGFNLLTKYRRCHLFSIDENELALACGERRSNNSERLERMARRLEVGRAWLTLGSAGSLVWSRDGSTQACPAFTRTTVDTVGAGDSFFATAALCSKVGADPRLSSLLANMAGALATRYSGNEQVTRKTEIVKNVRYLLKSVG